jgi:cytochrome c6
MQGTPGSKILSVSLGRMRARAAWAAVATVAMVVIAGCGDGRGTTDVAPPPPPSGGGQLAAGKAIFTAHCGGCHTLADAGSTGAVGPNLDQSKPAKTLVVERVTNGGNVMPSFTDKLSGGHILTDAQVQAVADYVSSVAGK